MKPLFISPDHQHRFEEDGFVKIPLLNSVQVAELLTAYRSVSEEHEKLNIPYITTSLSYNPELIRHVDTILQQVMGPAIDKFMIHYKLLFGNFLVKMPVDHSETAPHQDITFVDEKEYASVNIWVALQDTDEKNGCMYFLKGSHKLLPTLRPACQYDWEYEMVKSEIIEQAETFTAKAGDAFIFNHAVVHGSYPNNSGKPRVAAVIAAYHSEAPLIHYYMPKERKGVLQKYVMTKEAFLNFREGEPPQDEAFLTEINYEFRQLSKKEFKALTNKNAGKSLIQSFADFFTNG